MRRLLVGALAAVVFLGLGQPASAQTVPYPDSMAATGDSITRAFNSGVVPWTEAPWNSWSTGSSGIVRSDYRRILAANPRILRGTSTTPAAARRWRSSYGRWRS